MLLNVTNATDDEGTYIRKVIAIKVEFKLFRYFPLQARIQENKVLARGCQTGVVCMTTVHVEEEARRDKAHGETTVL